MIEQTDRNVVTALRSIVNGLVAARREAGDGQVVEGVRRMVRGAEDLAKLDHHHPLHGTLDRVLVAAGVPDLAEMLAEVDWPVLDGETPQAAVVRAVQAARAGEDRDLNTLDLSPVIDAVEAELRQCSAMGRARAGEVTTVAVAAYRHLVTPKQPERALTVGDRLTGRTQLADAARTDGVMITTGMERPGELIVSVGGAWYLPGASVVAHPDESLTWTVERVPGGAR